MSSPKSENKSSNQTNLGYLLIQVVLIVIGVLLGLAANEWRVARAEKAQAKNALRYIKDELQRNKEHVAKILPYHTKLSDTLKVFAATLSMNKRKLSFSDLYRAMPSGFGIPLLEKTGWQLANQTGAIDHMDYDLAVSLSKLYAVQDFIQAKYLKVGDNFYVAGNINLKDMSGLIISLALLANDILINEQELSELYEAMIKKL
ncbi:MAG: hypothetical protein ONB37_13395 [candidate division KSB1 bacterium]|nr:hypothetical protein [candidate division KSB1 bacterium]